MTIEKFNPISKGLFIFLVAIGMALLLSESRTKKTLATDSMEIDSSAILSDTLLENKMKQEISGIDLNNPPFRGSGLNRAIPNSAFGAGERLVYSVGYGMIKAGEASLEVKDVTKLDGNKCFHIISTAKSNRFFSFFFNVDDRVESYMDVYGLFSLRFEKHLIEGKFRAEAYVQFDQKRSLAISGKDTISTSRYVQDALSVLYYARTQKLEVGKSISMDNYADRKNYLLEIKVHRKETVEVPAGKFDCIVVEPQLKGSTIFKHEGKLTVWLTDDEKKMPVLMKSKAFIGSVSASLKEYRLGEVGNKY